MVTQAAFRNAGQDADVVSTDVRPPLREDTMSNPYFARSPYFKDGATATAPATTPRGYPTMPGYTPGQQTAYGQAPSGYGQQPAYGQVGPDQLRGLEEQYQAPSAANVDMRRMTYDDVIIRTAGIFAVILAVGAISWSLATSQDTSLRSMGFLMLMAGVVGGLVFGLVNSFKREPSPVLIMVYAVFEGAMLGGFSGIMENIYPGIVLQAVLATGATFGVMLAAYKFGGFRLSGKAQRILLVAMGGYLLFSLVNMGLMLTGAVSDPWGLRSSVTILGVPLGLIVGVLAVVMAAISLTMDFDFIQRGVERGLPQRYAWAGAFGLVVTLVWLYVEFLRILAILRDN